ncbi:endo-alpha-N-acetylgalactosaminidase family protein [Paenibacillus faecalis]|uniref:endo-alpha-N-acetylgalactosaminidase family protein n=1 Tax=Paenibacillus faecalis TaxID=2079532 RepID=UPI00131A5EAC|nr:endo-alpha-N-acetylgalactosaminidase family protein [Paenibacillus faecalis]
MTETIGWYSGKGKGKWSQREGEVIELYSNNTDTVIVNGDSPMVLDGDLEFTMTPLSRHGRIGTVIRYASPDRWLFIGCDVPMDPFGKSTWVWSLPNGEQGKLFQTDPCYEGKKYRIKLRYIRSELMIWLNGYQVYHGYLPQSEWAAGRMGVRAWTAKDGSEGCASFADIRYEAVRRKEAAANLEQEAVLKSELQIRTIESDELEVDIDALFPRVLRYKWKSNGAVMFGYNASIQKSLSCFYINGDPYIPVVDFASDEAQAEYLLSFPCIQVDMKVILNVQNHVLEMKIIEVCEYGPFLVKTISIPGHSLISIRSDQTGAHAACSEGVKGDAFWYVSDRLGEPLLHYYAYAILNTTELSATIHNNVLHNRRRLCVQSAQEDGIVSVAVSNQEWAYRGPDDEVLGEPWSKVILTADRNGDGAVDWQDGAIALREQLVSIPGSEMLRRSYAHIAMNFAGMVQFPFLRILDNVKKLFLYTDGFGQMLELKGYASEGHDSGHPDYGNINSKAGGSRDFNILIERASEFNTSIGVHINHSEAYPEARAYHEAIMTTTPGWCWLDQSYYMDREKDILSGGMDQRLDELQAITPKLGFVYVDTYRDEHWAALRLTRKLHDNGWIVWTEESDMLNEHAVWTHDSTGDSQISRFLYHTQKDVYAPHPLLKGGYARHKDNGFMGWQQERDLVAVVEAFFTKQLPYRYLMHFAVMKWCEHEMILDKNVVVRREKDQIVMYCNDRKIAEDNLMFIPWSPYEEHKIYHWNPEGGSSTWTLPDSWRGKSVVKLYQLTDLGRIYLKDIPVSDQKVTIIAEAKTPYVIYPEEAPELPEIEWGEGSPVRDTGFDSHDFKYWTPSAQCNDLSHIKIVNTSYGQTYLQIQGNDGADACISQPITGLEPGKTYAASVWVQLSKNRKASITVRIGSSLEVKREMDNTSVVNWDINSDKRGTFYQRMRLRFTMPKDGSKSIPLLLLRAEKGEAVSFVHFDDVRIREVNQPSPLPDHACEYYEDFEQIDEGWGPFVSSHERINKTHLSQRHEGYTKDTIGGEWSMKTMNERQGEVVRTVPSTVDFKPNQNYTIMFDYDADHDGQYSAVVKTTEHILLHRPLKKGRQVFTASCSTGDFADVYFAIVKENEEDGALIIDHFTVRSEK